MKIIQTKEGNKGVFTAYSDKIEAGQMTYAWVDDTKIRIDHTEVNPKFKGQGVGKKLLLKAVAFARNDKVKIIPLCPFAKAMFDKTAEINDVLL